jgi:hypothetical protein
MKEFIGKKLLWTGEDEESGKTYLFFEGMLAVTAEELGNVEDGASVAEKIIKEKLPSAANIMELQKILIARGAAIPPELYATPVCHKVYLDEVDDSKLQEDLNAYYVRNVSLAKSNVASYDDTVDQIEGSIPIKPVEAILPHAKKLDELGVVFSPDIENQAGAIEVVAHGGEVIMEEIKDGTSKPGTSEEAPK